MPLGILYNIGDTCFELSKIGKCGTLEFSDPQIQFLDGTFLHKFLHKVSDIRLDVSKIEYFQNLLVLARAQPVLAHAQLVPARAQTLKSSFGKVSIPFINSSQNR